MNEDTKKISDLFDIVEKHDLPDNYIGIVEKKGTIFIWGVPNGEIGCYIVSNPRIKWVKIDD